MSDQGFLFVSFAILMATCGGWCLGYLHASSKRRVSGTNTSATKRRWVMFEFIWKWRHKADVEMLAIMERIASASERQCEAVEASHYATIENCKAASEANRAALQRAEKDAELTQLHIDKFKRDNGLALEAEVSDE